MILRNKDPEQDEYIELQRKYNSVHVRGESENLSDYESMERAVEEIKRFPPHRSFLDVGCRVGSGLVILADEFPQAVLAGVDLVGAFVDKAREKVPGATVQQGDMHALAYPARNFDWVVCKATLEHAHDPVLAVGELCRVTGHALYVTADLEDEEEFSDNPCHFSYTPWAEDWIELFPEEFELRWQRKDWSRVHDRWGMIEMIWVRKQ